MRITLIDAGKRFNRDWIFRHLSYEFTQGHTYAITGPNGSGKSTLLQAIAGAIGISEGAARYDDIPPDQVYQHIALAAPYVDLIEEMTATEFLQFHAAFKPFLPDHPIRDILRQVGLEAAAAKQIRYYSSGMRQRLKLAQALFSDVPVLLLDEPCTNLDAEGIEGYRQLVARLGRQRIVIVSSNDRQEYDFCENVLSILDYK